MLISMLNNSTGLSMLTRTQLRDSLTLLFHKILRNSYLALLKLSSVAGSTTERVTYRKINNIPDAWGTGATVQTMVFGNLNEKSGTGVAFTRNPSTGDKELYGEYLMNAQGEDVVAGFENSLAN